jgi:hypothetical protein
MPAKSKAQLREPLTEELAYLAGIVDGEGCIGAAFLRDKRRNRSASVMFTVRVHMTDRQPIDLLSELYGGRIINYQDNRLAPRRPGFIWQGYSGRGATLLQDILPYLRVKRGQAEAFLEAMNSFTGGPVRGVQGVRQPTPQDFTLRYFCARRIRQLNQRVIYAG